MFIFYRMPSTAEVARVTLSPFALPLVERVTLSRRRACSNCRRSLSVGC